MEKPSQSTFARAVLSGERTLTWIGLW